MTRHRLETGESLQDYIERRIDDMFNDLAAELGDIHTNDADTAAAIPFELLIKCEKLKAAWRDMHKSEALAVVKMKIKGQIAKLDDQISYWQEEQWPAVGYKEYAEDILTGLRIQKRTLDNVLEMLEDSGVI